MIKWLNLHGIIVMYMLNVLKNKVLSGEMISSDEALTIARWGNLGELCDAAGEICRHFCGNKVDTCSIINARSGCCGEDCKWCAQSAHFKTGVDEYKAAGVEETLALARYNDSRGIHRFSLVTSGRRVTGRDMEYYCNIYRRLGEETGLYLCASMGLIGEVEMKMLRDAGVKRYHCNLETAPSFFPALCSTHTTEDKIATIKMAKSLGLAVCSGGIIGMGESMEQRVELAMTLRELDVDSVPINILIPIPGTPLQDMEPISEEEIMRTVAMFRFVLPDKFLRFAGGRARLSKEAKRRILTGGMNGVLMGDMLTTIGNRIDEDRELFRSLGLAPM